MIKVEDINHYLVLINRTAAKEDGSDGILRVICYFEILIIFLDYIFLFFLIYLLFKCKTYHFNLRVLWLSLGCEYLAELSIRSIEIFHFWVHPFSPEHFALISIVRCICYSFVSCFLPAIMIERACAAYFLKDYEKKKRSWISATIIIINISSASCLSIYFHYVISTLWLQVFVLIINILSSFTNYYLENYNYKKLRESTNLAKGKREYSLAERFQIAENIRTCTMIKVMINLVSFFNLVCSIALIMDNFSLTPSWRNISATIFNICVLIYGSLALTVMFLYTDPWRLEAETIFNKFCPKYAKKRPTICHHDFVAQTNQYFTHLNSTWDREFQYRGV